MSQTASTAHRFTFRFLVLALLAAGFAGQSSLKAQTVTPSRITAPISDQAMVSLRGNVHPLARAEFDRGPAPVSLPTERIILVLKRSPEQQVALTQYLAALQDPGSASYQKFLTPEQFGQLYGPSDADLQALTTWLTGHGFQIDSITKGRTALEFSGNVGQVQDTFKTSVHSYVVKGAQHWANSTDPQIPAALAPIIAGFASLNNFTAHPYHTRAPSAQADGTTHKVTPLLTSPSGPTLYVGPADAATIYDTPNQILNKNYAATKNLDGTGITIGVAGNSNIDSAIVDRYRSLFGLPTNTPTIIVDGGTDPGLNGDEDEALLDLEISGGIAPGAKVNFYTAASTTVSDGLFLAITRAIQDNVVSILNVSFGNCEANFGTSGNQFVQNLWEQAAAQGITATVSTGDSGSAGCDDPNAENVAQDGLAVNAIASTPFNIAVGGTDYVVLPTAFSTYATTTNTPTYLRSALKYIPERPWNDSTTSNAALAQNTPYRDSNGNSNIVAAGGGVSQVYAKPAWQKNVTPADSARDLPDVSFLAANGLYDATWAVCASPYTYQGQQYTDCAPDSSGNFYLSGFGGTSASAPAFAGMLALIQQSAGHRLGQANVALYKLFQAAPTAFHDVTTGNISVFCTGGSPANCGSNSFLTGYDAKTGYDVASGLGSVDLTTLINNWSKAALTSTSTSLALGKTTFVHGTSVDVSGGVTGSGGTPSGDVAITTSSTTPNAASQGGYTLDGSGKFSATGSNGYTLFPGGSYSVFANYGGDTTFAASTSTGIPVTVSPENSTLYLTVNVYAGNGNFALVTPGSSIPYGNYLAYDGTPFGASQAGQSQPYQVGTGTVTFSDSSAALPGGTISIGSDGNAEYQIGYNTPAGSHSITGAYSGDPSYNASTGGPIAFTVTKAPTSVTISNSGSTITATIIPNPLSGGAYPSGTITLNNTTHSTVVATPAVASYQDPSTGASEAQVIYTVDTSKLPAGANLVTATYMGDTNYAASSPSTAVTITGTGTAVSFALTAAAASPASVTAGSSATSALTVTPAGGFTGAVALTCSVAGPTGAVSLPTCSPSPASVSIAGTAAGTSTLTIATTTTTTAGAYTVTVTGTPPTGSAATVQTTTVALTVTGGTPTPSIALTASAASPTSFAAGGSALSALAVTPGGGFTGAVALTCVVTGPTGATSLPTCTPAPASVSITGTAPGTSSMTIATTTTTTVGAYTVTVTATPPAGSAAAQTATVTFTVTAAAIPGDFTLAAAAASPASVSPGGGSTSALTVTPSGGFTGAVALTCAVVGPSGAMFVPTCSLSPASVTITGTTAGTSTLNLATTAATSGALGYPGWVAGGGGAILACVLFFGIPARRRGWRAMLGLLVFVFVIGGIGCGGSSSSSGSGGTTAGTYTITVTATPPAGSTAAVKTATVTLTVN
jgi:trimeric autotransporter adhesin